MIDIARTYKRLLAAMPLMVVFGATIAAAEDSTITLPQSDMALLYRIQDEFRALTANILPSVVGVATIRANAGSGVIVEALTDSETPGYVKYYVLTNYHVIDGFLLNEVDDLRAAIESLEALHSGSHTETAVGRAADSGFREEVYIQIHRHPYNIRWPATHVASSRRYDVALLSFEVDARADIVDVAKIGDSSSVTVGDLVFAAGNPAGTLTHPNTVSFGIVSSSGRENLYYFDDKSGQIASVRLDFPELHSKHIFDLIQFDAAISPGSSGGPLLNIAGEVIGINFLVDLPGNDLNFAIPINTLKPFLEQVLTSGVTQFGYVGVVPFPFGESPGAPIGSVVPQSPADRAGLRPGDWVFQIDDQPIRNSAHLMRTIDSLSPDKESSLLFYRSPNENLTEVIVCVSISPLTAVEWPGMGVSVSDGRWRRRYFEFPVNQEGPSEIRVAYFTDGGVLRDTGLLAGDVILSINGESTLYLDEFYAAIHQCRHDGRCDFQVDRSGLQGTIQYDVDPSISLAQGRVASCTDRNCPAKPLG